LNSLKEYEVRIIKTKFRKFEESVIIFFLISLLYLLAFYISMDFASDRASYIKVFSGHASERMEPGYKFIGIITFKVFRYPDIAMTFTQAFVFSVYFILGFKRFVNSNCLKVKLLIWSALFLGVFASLAGVQIRFGMAVVLSTFLVSLSRKRGFGLKYFLISLALSMTHYGVAPFLIVNYFSGYINSLRSLGFFVVLALSLVSVAFVFSELPEILGLSSYYSAYFSGEFEQERILSFTGIFYMLLAFGMFLMSGRVDKITCIGISLFFLSIYMQAPIFQKLMIPFLMLSSLIFIENVRIKADQYFLFMALGLLGFLFSYIYFLRFVALI